MEEILNLILSFLKRFSPYIIGGAVGSIIHRMRTAMNFITFLKSIVVSIFLAFCVGIVCKDYLEIKNDNVIFVFCGISGTFSKLILDELEEAIKLIRVYIRIKLGISKKDVDKE